jgi:ribosomal protein S18 acetylase RimI-like enzyme
LAASPALLPTLRGHKLRRGGGWRARRLPDWLRLPIREGEAYIHFIGVHPDRRNKGVGRHLYELFFDEVGKRGCTKVSCITSPVNEGSLAFHRAMGFSLKESDTEVDGVPVHRHYDGLNRDRVVFEKTLYS